MTSSVDYVFTRDYFDNNRINLQHYLWVELFGYLIHPGIPITKPDLKIADVGTGTGIWLTDLSRRLPSSVNLDGIDISFDAAPLPEWLPPNMTLFHWDIKQEVPVDLIEKYDVLQIRNFAFVLQDNEISDVLGKLNKMIKPGGYLQWAEPDMSSFRIEKTGVKNEVAALSQLLQLSQGQDSRLKPTWVSRLPSLFSDAGFHDILSDVQDASPHLAIAMHECNLPIHDLVARKTNNTSLIQELRKLMPEVLRETREGSYWAFTRWTVIGQKV